MAIDSNFTRSLPKYWESISSESGVPLDSRSRTNDPFYNPSTVSESDLVRLVINALQGVKSALDDIERISAAFCSDPADRTSHRIHSLWHRSSSTNVVGKILKSIGRSGFIFFLLRKFVDYFLCISTDINRKDRDNDKREGEQTGPEPDQSTHYVNAAGIHPPYSLVNQAFSVAVGKVLEGYNSSLNTLYASVQLRHSLKNSDVSSGVGCLTSVIHSEITVLEVYLHTKELRTHIEALGNLCFLKRDLNANTVLDFHSFPRGADLLTHLYVQLWDADPVHRVLLKFLFVRSCEPYCGFIKSWIYRASIDDPYEEFIVEYLDDSRPYSHSRSGHTNEFPLASIKERDGVSVPCFLKDVCRPLVRAGQQLRILIKLLDLCNSMTIGDKRDENGFTFSFNLTNMEDILPYWNASSNGCVSFLYPLTSNKREVETMIHKRGTMYKIMQERLQSLFARLNIRCQQTHSNVIPFGTVPIFIATRKSSRTRNFPIRWTSDEWPIFPSSTADQGTEKLDAGAEFADASSTSDEFSYEIGSSDSVSLDSFEEQNDCEGSGRLNNILSASEPRCLTTSMLSPCLDRESTWHKPHKSEGSDNMGCDSQKTCESLDPNLFGMSDTGDVSYHSGICWPLGGLLKNPFYADGEYRGQTHSHCTDYGKKVADENMDILKSTYSYFGKMYVPDISEFEIAAGKFQLENEKFEAPSNACMPKPQNRRCNYNFLNVNPMLTKNAWFHLLPNSRDRKFMDYKKISLPHFDFLSVENPCKVYGERLFGTSHNGFQAEHPVISNIDISAVGEDEFLGEQCYDGDDIPVDTLDRSIFCSAHLSTNAKEGPQEEDLSVSVSGGAKWEDLLNYSYTVPTLNSGGLRCTSMAGSEIPLDIIVDKCILQEILLQYKYVSGFTIKLLEEGFNLREHFLALRRYHFMELADWADSFITSLWHQKWNVVEGNQRISEIQGFLDSAVQRSSCERDEYKERLFVYMKGQGTMPLSNSAIGIHAFDFIALGYRVEWPVSLVLTPDALKIYAEIFSFLTQVKLAVFSLTDIWHSLKDLMHLTSRNQDSAVNNQEMKYFNILMKIRQQVNHFVSTLQQYVQSQLSHVSWCRFLHSLKNQVKDILDLDSVHMTYLSESLHICFLSVETRPVANIIESILQCALDFRSCFTGGGWNVGPDRKDSSELLARINFTQVISIKATFEKNLNELYLRYLKSPKHSEFSLCRFWLYLNYNDYYSNITGR